MRGRNGFTSYQEFRREMLGNGMAPVSAALEDMADEMYQANVSQEFDSLWDSADAEDD